MHAVQSRYAKQCEADPTLVPWRKLTASQQKAVYYTLVTPMLMSHYSHGVASRNGLVKY